MIDQDDTSVHGAQEPEAAEPTPTSVVSSSSAEEPEGLFDYEDANTLADTPESEQAQPVANDYVELPEVSAFAEAPGEQPNEALEAADEPGMPGEQPAELPSEPETAQLAFGDEAVDAESAGGATDEAEYEPAVESGQTEDSEPAAESVLAEEMPDDLRAVNELLDRPTAEIMAITADTPGNIAEGGQGEAETEPGAEGEQAAVEGEAVEGEQAPAEGEQVATALDDIEPGTVAGTETDAELGAEGLAEGPITSVSWWPFIGYMVAWLAVAGFAVWQMEQLPAGQAAYESDLYSISILAGLVLLGIGPILLLIVWLASWIGRSGVRIGSLFISALIKGATATLFGAIVWIGALMLIDYFRLGRPY